MELDKYVMLALGHFVHLALQEAFGRVRQAVLLLLLDQVGANLLHLLSAIVLEILLKRLIGHSMK